jgi:predicted ATPase
MRFDRIAVSNFKSFDKMTIDLGRLNVIIGANASGKTNFVNVFKFLKDVFSTGLDNAISMQGGVDCIRNFNIGASEPLSIEISMVSDKNPPSYPMRIKRGKKRVRVQSELVKSVYSFSIDFFKRKKGYFVGEERLVTELNLIEIKKEEKDRKKWKRIAKGRMIMTLDKMGKFDYHFEPNSFTLPRTEIFPFRPTPKIRKRHLRSHKDLMLLGANLIMGVPINLQALLFFSPLSVPLRNSLSGIAVYDIDPKLAKKSTLITGKTELEFDGNNLATVLQRILSTKRSRLKIASLMRDLLPFVQKVSFQKLADRSLLPCVCETYWKNKFLPAPLISDGTINLTALVIALYFERNPIIVIEEPERNIHPRLLSKLMDMMKDVSEKLEKQIIVTTHNPEVVKNAGIENLVLIHRHKDFSRIERPGEKGKIQEFLKNEIGVDELFVRNLLEG